MYALVQYAARCNQETLAPKKADDSGLGGRVTSPPRIDLHAISIARGTPEQNQRRIQGQPSTGINGCTAANETTPGGSCSSNPEPDRQHAPFISSIPGSRASGSCGRVGKIFCRRKAF